MLDGFFVIDKHASYRETTRTESMMTEEEQFRMSHRRKSEDLRRSSKHNPLVRINSNRLLDPQTNGLKNIVQSNY